MALEMGDEIEANQLFSEILKSQRDDHLESNQARIYAIQARRAYQRGEIESSEATLQKALELLTSHKLDQFATYSEDLTGSIPCSSDVNLDPTRVNLQSPTSALLSVAIAANELKKWDIALYLTRCASDQATSEPFSQLLIAKILVLKAEFQQTCQELSIIHHAPGISALADHAYMTFKQALSEAIQGSGIFPRADDGGINEEDGIFQPYKPADILDKWRIRGEIVFHKIPKKNIPIKAMLSTADDTAALVAAL